jgi:epidermal growth factor receptor substrate 15
MEMPVPETHRRKNHIDLIDPDHALLPIITDSLKFQDRDRPSSEELCQRLAGLKESREYRESTHQMQNKIQSSSDQVLLLTQQLQEKDRSLQQKDGMLREKDNEISRRVQEKDRTLQQLQQKERQFQEERASREQQLQEVTSRERQLRQLNQQLEEQEQVTAEIQQTNHSLQRQVEQLQQQLSQQSLKPPQPPPPSQAQVRGQELQERESRKQLPVQPSLAVDHKPHPHRVREMTLNWRDGGKVSLKMIRGAAVLDRDMAYFIDRHGDICSYDSNSKKIMERSS